MSTFPEGEKISVDENAYDGEGYDSAISESDFSDTTTLNSEITSYRYENGRRYAAFKEGQYWGPNDEKQQNQLDIFHHIASLLLDGALYLAPLEKPQRVLDIGTGTGLWAIDFAEAHPQAEVIGTDLSPIQPGYIPANLKFEVDDACDPWTWKDNFFDYIHIRTLYGSIDDWPKLYSQAYDKLAPGGWIEQMELPVEWGSDDNTVAGTVYERWGKLFVEIGDISGRTFRIINQSKELIEKAGFVNVTEKRFKLPVGTWAKDEKYKTIGKWNRLHCEEGIEGWAMFLCTRWKGWTTNQVHEVLDEMRTVFADRRIHAYLECNVVTAQKPLDA